ncbi:TIGR04211 family SH3 domain-containing protein [Gilvimarinus polysaccharolyticus]|uniref:TIGR04211 family SH3 domain-containing protein n=1 Tax=Gilvimarinus polysaccharolyticus TaxID=863921 RepID=UPI00067390BD|nr:TIGR04211 family SH3 domain-containing protein [Gilvimarinus polysaccharolyticus]
MTTPTTYLKTLVTAAIFSVGLIGIQANAETQYIADTLQVPLRSGMGNQYRIVHRGLPSGTKLELIKRDSDESDGHWALVRTKDGLEGWVREQYLLSEPTAAIKLAHLEQKMGQLDGDQTELLDANEALENNNKELAQSLSELQDQHQKTTSEFAELRKLSGNTIALNEQYQKLNENYQLLQTRAEVLKTDNERLKNNLRYKEWLIGAGILLSGIILSLILQSFGRRKRRSEWG